jgi:hypothetical protein
LPASIGTQTAFTLHGKADCSGLLLRPIRKEVETMYPPEIRDAILARIAAGESLRSVCRDEGMPAISAVMRWRDEDADFGNKYARAREAQADVLFDGMAAIEGKVEEGSLKPDAARVILDSQRWRAEKLKPKAYGSKVDVNHAGRVELSLGVQFGRSTA